MKENEIRISTKQVIFDVRGALRSGTTNVFEVIQGHKILRRFIIKEDAEDYVKKILQNV